MKTNIITNNTNMKRYLKYLCAVLLVIGMSAHAWATVTDTFDDFANCGWGFSTSAYDDGTYTLDKLTLIGEDVKANTYDVCIMLAKTNGGGSVTLPSFDGTVSKIKLYTHSNCDGSYNTEVGVYVNGVYKTTIIMNRSTLNAQYTFSPAVAKGAVITLHNESKNAVAQLTKIEVTHEGAAISSGANSITKFNEPADGGTFTCTVGGNEVSSAAEDAIVQLTATPNSGYTLLGFVVTGNYGYCSYDTYVPWTEDITVNGSNQFTMPDGNVTVEALWEETVTYAVTYDRSKALCAQNGSGSWPSNATGLTSGTIQALPTDIELNGVDGYTFAGWTTNESYPSSSTAPSPLYTTNVTVTSNITLYPVFSQSGSTGPSVTFNAQSGGIAAGYYVFCYGQSGTQNALGSELNTTTYKLDPVAISVTSSTSSVTDRKAMWQIEASGTYWTIKNVYTGKYVALKRNGDAIQKNKVDMVSSVTNDAKWIFDVQSDHYYVKSAADANYFLRYYGSENIWNINNGSNPNNNGGSLYLYKSTSTPAATTSTYTIQPPCTTYTLTYNGNGAATGSVPAAATEYASGAVVTVKGNSGELAKPGYDFNGWKTGASSGTAYAAGSNITMTQNYTLHAQWLAHTISLVLDANGGETNGYASVKYDGTELEAGMVGATGLTGKTLLGYYAAADGDTKVLNANGSFAGSAVTGYITSSKWSRDETPTTLYAHWRQNTYTVVFDKNASGPTGTMSNQNFTYGTAQNLNSNTYTWSAHNFEGWATEPSGGVVYGNGAEVNNLTTTDGGTVTLYAVWTNKTYNDYKFTCVDIALTTEDTDPVLVTSRNGINVMAKKKLLLTVDGTTGTIDLSSTDDVLKFYKKTTSAPIRYVELTGANRLTAPVTNYEVYVSYAPTSGGSGGFVYPDITVTRGANVRNYPGKVVARNLPDAVAIVAKVGDTWHALPANMTVAVNPEPVPVTVAAVDGILKATGPSTVSYKLWPVATTNGTRDRFGTASSYTPNALYGDRLRFAGNGNKALWTNNNATANTVNNDGTITAIDKVFADVTADAAYEWEVTTTLVDGQFVYNLKTNQSKNSNFLRMKEADFKWGTYSSGNTNELYILPLIGKTPAEVKVLEWGTNEIVVSYPNGANATAITAKIGNGGTSAVTKTPLGGDIFKLTGVGNLQSNPSKTLTLDITESGSAKQIIYHIPLIVTVAKTEAELRGAVPGANATERNRLAKLVDVVIRNGGSLTTGTASGAFKDLYIYPGAKVDLSQNFSIKNIYLRGGFSWSDNKATFLLPQMKVTDGKEISGIGSAGNGVYYDLYADFARYYMVALPKTVAAAALTNEENGDDWDANIKYYDGNERALAPQANCWKWITGVAPYDNIERGVGYEIAVKPRKAGAMNGRTIGILRFPLLKAAAWSNEGDCTPTVTAHGIAGYNANPKTVTANNVGWNLLGNPFFTAFTNSGAGLCVDGLKEHKENGQWTGSYDWVNEELKYYTIPNKTDYDYTDVRSNTYKLEAFWPFFVQTKTNGTVTFAAANRALRAKALLPQSQEQELTLDFMLADNNGKTDEAGLNISDDYSANFDFDDKEKTIDLSAAKLKLYTVMDGYRIAYNSLPEAAIQQIPLGYLTAEGGEMSVELLEGTDINRFEQVMLIDNDLDVEWDLLQDAYDFTTDAMPTGNDTRFVLSLKIKQGTDISTGLDNLGSGLDKLSATGYEGSIVLHGVPEGAGVWVFDMNGKLLESRQQSAISSQRVELESLPVGVYNVRVVSGNEAKTLRVIVR